MLKESVIAFGLEDYFETLLKFVEAFALLKGSINQLTLRKVVDFFRAKILVKSSSLDHPA